jgi:hypothetical protein
MKHHDRGYGHKGVPLREPACASYDPNTGRAASSVDGPNAREHVWAGNHAKPDPQIPGGFDHIDQQRTQNPQPVKHRPFTKVHE